MDIKLKHVIVDTDRHRNERVYFRKRGLPKVRLRERLGSEAFHEEYRCALLGVPYVRAEKTEALPKLRRAAPGTFRELVEKYLTRKVSTQALATRTKKRAVLEEICRSTAIGRTTTPVGERPVSGMKLEHVAELRDEKVATPEAANHRVKVLSAMFKWGMEAGIVKHNPAEKCTRFESNKDGHHTWTEDEIAAFEARHPPGCKAHLAFTIFRYTGLRVSDVAVFGRQHLYDAPLPDGGTEQRLRITPKKTSDKSGVTVDLPVLLPLAQVLASVPKTSLIFLMTEWGRPFTVNGLGNKMRDWCDEAGLPQCSSHGIRKADAVIAAESGATSAQLQAMFGWTSSRQADHYTRKAQRKIMASAGAKHLL